MLKRLEISNVALIDKLSIDFDSGLNILTGETGAGKSIIIDSINTLIGDRTNRELIRSGADSAYVEGLFEISADGFPQSLKSRISSQSPRDSSIVQRNPNERKECVQSQRKNDNCIHIERNRGISDRCARTI